MKSHLPIDVEELLSGAVETARLALKATWDSATTGPQIIRTLCAFANDAQNLNGGYLVVGVAERDGVAVRPAQGMPDELIAAAQSWIRGHCNQIDPIYMPVFDVVAVDEVRVLVIWAPASETRPHQAPDGGKGDRRFWIREGSDSVAAKGDRLTQLMQQAARVPFDDRRAAGSTNEDLSLANTWRFWRAPIWWRV